MERACCRNPRSVLSSVVASIWGAQGTLGRQTFSSSTCPVVGISIQHEEPGGGGCHVVEAIVNGEQTSKEVE